MQVLFLDGLFAIRSGRRQAAPTVATAYSVKLISHYDQDIAFVERNMTISQ